MRGEIVAVQDGEDTIVYLDEVDLEFIEEKVEYISKDPFLKIDVTKSKGLKTTFNRLQKRYAGTGASTKYVDPSSVSGYSLMSVMEPPFDMEALAALYDENATLHAVVDARVMNTVGLGYEWEPTSKARKQTERSSGSEDKSARVRAAHTKEMDRLNDLFEAMNEEETIIESLRRALLDYLTIGNGYIEIGRNRIGEIGYIGHVPGKLVRVRRERDGFVQSAGNKSIFFRNFGDTTTKDPINGDSSPNEMIHFKMYTPNDNYYGVPPAVAAMAAIVGDKFAKEFNIDYFENKAIPRYAIILKGVKLSNVSKNELIKYFRNEVKGKNHGTLVVPLPATIGSQQADIEFKKLEADTQEGSFDQYRKSNRDEVISSYRVPPTKVGVLDNANLAVARDADKTFKVQVVGPDQVMVEKRFNRIVKEFTDLFLFKFKQLDVVDEDMRSRIHDRYLRTGVITPNEVRIEIGHSPIPEGDKPLAYAPNTKQEELEWRMEQGDTSSASSGVGNDNNSGTFPQASGQDNGSNQSDAEMTGTNNERGQSQDSTGVRERS